MREEARSMRLQGLNAFCETLLHLIAFSASVLQFECPLKELFEELYRQGAPNTDVLELSKWFSLFLHWFTSFGRIGWDAILVAAVLT